MKPISFKNYPCIEKNEFLAGFEVEFIYNSTKISPRDLHDKFSKLNNLIIIGYDGSIGGYDYGTEQGIEVKTPPLPVKDSIILLIEVFKIVKQYGRTNATCGLHLNISPIPDQFHNSVDVISFAQDELFEDIKCYFGRSENGFCRKVLRTEEKGTIQALFDNKEDYEITNCLISHFSVVSLRHLRKIKDRCSRIEIRAMGNSDYHKKLPTILKYTHQTLETYLKYCTI